MAEDNKRNRGWFPEGKSGNLKGRPKESKNHKTLLESELETYITVKENGRKMRITKEKAIIKGLVNDAVGRDPRAMEMFIGLRYPHGGRKRDFKTITAYTADKIAAAEPLTTEEAAKKYMEAIKNAKPIE